MFSGDNKPPLCKGRWLAQARRRDCNKAKIYRKTIPQSPTVTAPFTQGSLWLVRLKFVCFF